MSNNHDHLSNGMTIVALVNGMIGGIILVMPILALKTGYLMISPVVLISGFFSYFSCLLCIRHLRNYKDLDEAVLKHFDNRKGYKIFYDVSLALATIVVLILYFDLICIQWSGLTTDSKLIPILNAIVLFPVVYIMKKYHFGESLLAYGIISVIGYCCFLLYMWIQAPSGSNKLQPVDGHFPELAAALSQGFAIQMFFIPVLKKNPNPHLYKRLLALTYIIGGLIYGFIGYGGALSIVNRTYPGLQKPETIVEYFDKGEWQVILVQIIYLVHLYSAFPQFLLISKKRVFSILQWPQPQGVGLNEGLYVVIIILICFIIKITNISTEVIIQLNGSILSFLFITIIPVALHIKCVYMSSGQKHQKWQDEQENQKKNQIDHQKYVYIDKRQSPNDYGQRKQEQFNNDGQNSDQKSKQQQKQQQIKTQYAQPKTKSSGSDQVIIQQPLQPQQHVCCDIKYKSKVHQYCELFLMFSMIVTGIATMVYTIYQIFNDNDDTTL